MEATLGLSYMPNLKFMEAPKLFSQHPGARLACSMGRGPCHMPSTIPTVRIPRMAPPQFTDPSDKALDDSDARDLDDRRDPCMMRRMGIIGCHS